MIDRGYSNVAYLEAALQCGTFRIGDPRLKNEAELLAEELMACEAEMVCDQKIAEELQAHADHVVNFNALLKRRLHDMVNARMEDSGKLYMLTHILRTELRDDDKKRACWLTATMGMWQEMPGINAGGIVPQKRMEAEGVALASEVRLLEKKWAKRLHLGCYVCGSEAHLYCKGCRRVLYCSTGCQKRDWHARHARQCGHFKPRARGMEELCIVCGTGACALCLGCCPERTACCSPKCQLQDWPEHRAVCPKNRRHQRVGNTRTVDLAILVDKDGNASVTGEMPPPSECTGVNSGVAD